MMNVTRRAALVSIGATALGSVLPSTSAEAKASGLDAQIDALNREIAEKLPGLSNKAREDSVFNKVFKHRKSLLSVERRSTLVLSTAKHKTGVENLDGQRFVWSFQHNAYGLAFNMVDDADPRRKEGYAGISELDVMLKAAVSSMYMRREEDAADVLNNSTQYDPRIGGDGVAACSMNHPCSNGNSWSNRIDKELTGENLKYLLQHIKDTSVDDNGNKILLRGKKLIAPASLMIEAMQALSSLGDEHPSMDREAIFWDYLTDEKAWFVQTHVDGLDFFEREPLEVRAGYDKELNCIRVVTYERNSVGCSDPRSIYGSFPS